MNEPRHRQAVEPAEPVVNWDRWRPHERATLLFVMSGGRILLIHKKRGLGAGKINGPGGRIEPGETPAEAAVREVREELGIHPIEVRAAGELRFQFVNGPGLHVSVFRAAGHTGGEPRETEEAIPLWADASRLPYDRMWADDRYWMPHLLAGRWFRGWFVFDGDRLLDGRVETAEGPA